MKRSIKPFRLVVLFIFLVSVLSVYVTALYKMQVIDGGDKILQNTNIAYAYSTVSAKRGDITDKNGSVLVTSSEVHSVKLNYALLKSSKRMVETVDRLIALSDKYGVKYSDTLPLTDSPTFEFTDMTSSQSSRLSKYLEHYKLPADIAAPDFVVFLRTHFGIDYTVPLTHARVLLGILYELDVRTVVNTSDYVFASGVPTSFVSVLSETGLPGVIIATDYNREYKTLNAAHLLGHTGLMTAEEYEKYKDLGYPMDAVIGKDGVEAAFEEYLHGENGRIKYSYDKSTGVVLSTEVIKEAVPGKNVKLSIDIGLQSAAEQALSDLITSLNTTRTEDLSEGGAIVVRDPNSGKVLACASYPTFDPAAYISDYAALAADETAPLFNRALLGVYNPGSTFKMTVAYAGLTTGKIDLNTYVNDIGRYMAYRDYQPKCWIYPGGHGELNVIGALANSCNYFFYWLGDHIGVDPIASASRGFGFGAKTGIELPESAGTVATPEYKKQLTGEKWFAADNLLTSIGQGYSYLTPIQLANYAACIANGGTLYKTTLLSEVRSSDYMTLVASADKAVLNSVDNSKGFITILQQGMRAVVTEGTALDSFYNYPIHVAAKTGTIESDTSEKNNAVFVCFAPYESPEIALSVVVEKGGSGGALIPAAKEVLNYYFASGGQTVSADCENVLLR